IVGKKCYEVYQRRKTICPWCPSKRVLEDGEQHTAEVPYPSEEEPIGWLELTSYPLKDSSGKISGIIEHVKDITEYKKKVKRITHLTKVLNAIRKVNQLIIHEKNQDILLQKVCDTLIETRGYSTAWIMLFGQHSEYLDSAESGFGKGFTALKKELNHGNFPACVRQALEQARPTEISDPSTTCADCPITDKYSDKGRMTIRLEHAKKVYGVLSVSFGVDITVESLDEDHLPVSGSTFNAVRRLETDGSLTLLGFDFSFDGEAAYCDPATGHILFTSGAGIFSLTPP
ncbi:MAG: PAS domain-containing protein, partial [Deltaproteobacteria bacterium]|nr:PAS domain-containing protein [Deltaproteobacteria bacterium]